MDGVGGGINAVPPVPGALTARIVVGAFYIAWHFGGILKNITDYKKVNKVA